MKKGKTKPRIETKRTTNTSRAEHFHNFCKNILNFELLPWQKHVTQKALQTDENNNYIYDIILVIVARQNGKTALSAALSAWWLHEDLEREQKRLHDARVLGVAQNLAIAEKPWSKCADWFDARENNHKQNAVLIEDTEHVFRGNGNKTIKLKNGITYSARDGYNSRGESASRVILDELREQTSFRVWNSVSQVTKTYQDGQVWCITSGGDGSAVALQKLRESALAQIDNKDANIAIFEYSAPEKCEITDEDAILSANPSCGYIESLTLDRLKKDASLYTENDYRLEVLSQCLNVSALSLFSEQQINNIVTDSKPEKEIVDKYSIAFSINGFKYSNALNIAVCTDNSFIAGLASDYRAGGLYGLELLKTLPREVHKYSFNLSSIDFEHIDYNQDSLDALYQKVINKELTLVNDESIMDVFKNTIGTVSAGGKVIIEGELHPIIAIIASVINIHSRSSHVKKTKMKSIEFKELLYV